MAGNSLAVQLVGLCSHNRGYGFLVRELGTHKLYSMTKKKKEFHNTFIMLFSPYLRINNHEDSYTF